MMAAVDSSSARHYSIKHALERRLPCSIEVIADVRTALGGRDINEMHWGLSIWGKNRQATSRRLQDTSQTRAQNGGALPCVANTLSGLLRLQPGVQLQKRRIISCVTHGRAPC